MRRLLTYIQGAFAAVGVTSTAAPTPPSDPDDEIFLLCALDGNADYLVSEDAHLPALRHDYRPPLIVACSESLPFIWTRPDSAKLVGWISRKDTQSSGVLGQ